MTPVHATLMVAAISTGHFTGLLMTILAFFQRVLKELSAPEFTLVMQRFLGVVRTHPLHYGLVITTILAPIAALVLLRGSAGSPTFFLILAGLISFAAGPFVVSRYFVEPIYDVFSSWEPESPLESWRVARDRYFRLNALRGLGSGAAVFLFLIGLSLLWPAKEVP